jgi:EF-hand domain-containing family member B
MQLCKRDGSTAQCFKTYPESDMMRWTLDRAEDVYYSKCREPLGRGWVRGHQLPPGAGDKYAFGERLGHKQAGPHSSAQDIIAPVDTPYDVSSLEAPACYNSHTQSLSSLMQVSQD